MNVNKIIQSNRLTALCVNCDKIHGFTDIEMLKKAHITEAFCSCGGDVCACEYCQEIITEMLQGPELEDIGGAA